MIWLMPVVFSFFWVGFFCGRSERKSAEIIDLRKARQRLRRVA